MYKCGPLCEDCNAIAWLRPSHRCPLELAIGQEVEHALGLRLRADIADIMDADVPFVAVAFVGVCVAAGRVVLFQHADFPAEFTEEGGRRQPAHPRADDNGVIFGSESVWPIAMTDAKRAGFHWCKGGLLLSSSRSS